MVNVNRMDARTMGQPGGLFDRLTQALNSAVDAHGRVIDRQAQRDHEGKLLQRTLDREKLQDKRQEERDAEERVARARELAGNGVIFPTTGNAVEDAYAWDLYKDRLKDRELKRSENTLAAKVQQAAAAKQYGILPEPENAVAPGAEWMGLKGLADERTASVQDADELRDATAAARRAASLRALMTPPGGAGADRDFQPFQTKEGDLFAFDKTTGTYRPANPGMPNAAASPAPAGAMAPAAPVSQPAPVSQELQQKAAGSLAQIEGMAGKARITPEQRAKFLATQQDLHKRWLQAASTGNAAEQNRIQAAIVEHSRLLDQVP